MRRVGDGFGIGDLKTGKTAVRADGHVETAGHAMQMGVYELMAEKASGLPITEPAQIIGLQTGKTERGQRVGTAEIVGAREMLVGDPTPGRARNGRDAHPLRLVPRQPPLDDVSRAVLPRHHNCKWRK
jgi:hypothetical protein